MAFPEFLILTKFDPSEGLQGESPHDILIMWGGKDWTQKGRFPILAPMLWNCLPQEIRLAPWWWPSQIYPRSKFSGRSPGNNYWPSIFRYFAIYLCYMHWLLIRGIINMYWNFYLCCLFLSNWYCFKSPRVCQDLFKI